MSVQPINQIKIVFTITSVKDVQLLLKLYNKHKIPFNGKPTKWVAYDTTATTTTLWCKLKPANIAPQILDSANFFFSRLAQSTHQALPSVEFVSIVIDYWEAPPVEAGVKRKRGRPKKTDEPKPITTAKPRSHDTAYMKEWRARKKAGLTGTKTQQVAAT